MVVELYSGQKAKGKSALATDNSDRVKRARWESQVGRSCSLGITRRSGARHLFDCWQEVARIVDSAKHLGLFLDFDGTLVPLRRRPSDVKPLGPTLQKVLRRLAADKRINVFVISGRRLRELHRLVRVRGVQLLGLHGWEGRAVPLLTAERKLLRIAKQRLDQCLPKTRQIWLEDKGLGLAVHYRSARPGVIRLARAAVEEVLEAVGRRIHMVQGHKVWELLPHQIDGKGPVVVAILSHLPSSTLPIVVGDDTSDESAFGVLRGGLTIHVGAKQHTRARYLLRNPEEVKMFLLKLEAAVR